MPSKYTKYPGWFKVDREIFNGRTWKNHNAFRLYIWCLSKANFITGHQNWPTPTGYTLVTIEPGSFITGRIKGAEETGLNESAWYRGIKFLQRENLISVKSNNQYTLITICDSECWNDKKDQGEQRKNSGGTTDEHNIRIENNDKNHKNHFSVEFEKFWVEYHDKTEKPKTDKEPALKKWSKLTDQERSLAFEKIMAYSLTNESQYLKKARTYLEDKTFNDEMKPLYDHSNKPIGKDNPRTSPVDPKAEQDFIKKYTA